MSATYTVPDTEIFAVRFDPDDQYLSICTLDGIVKVYNLQTSVFYVKFNFNKVFV